MSGIRKQIFYWEDIGAVECVVIDDEIITAEPVDDGSIDPWQADDESLIFIDSNDVVVVDDDG